MQWSLMASSPATEGSAVILQLFLVLLAAKVGHEVAARLHQPALVGEVLARVIVGPAVLGVGPAD